MNLIKLADGSGNFIVYEHSYEGDGSETSAQIKSIVYDGSDETALYKAVLDKLAAHGHKLRSVTGVASLAGVSSLSTLKDYMDGKSFTYTEELDS